MFLCETRFHVLMLFFCLPTTKIVKKGETTSVMKPSLSLCVLLRNSFRRERFSSAASRPCLSLSFMICPAEHQNITTLYKMQYQKEEKKGY
mmetsp:Transcript_8711/g.13470  ORF Transcript_8711/g.13470 Transcript_8711/m.13470 type:complete len:91 (-) Transcript_8711:686-958(-)